jgi:predicted Zn-dependent protease
MKMARFLLIGIFALLAACATPSVNTPALSEDAVRQERELQTAAAKAQQGIKVTTREPAYYMSQLKRVAPRIRKAGMEVCQGIDRASCEFDFKLVDAKNLNAAADGQNVTITTGMMAFAGSDDAVASILAHEYAHNLLGHVSSTQRNVTLGTLGGALAQQILQSRGIEMGNLSDLGGQMALMRYSKTFEQEADHVGLYIAQRAGYDLGSMPDIWRRMAAADSRGIYAGSTHPTYPERYIAMQQTINEIHAKEEKQQALLPTFQEKKRYF